MKKIFSIKAVSFFHIIEKNIWEDRIHTNPYFATVSILISTIVAALTTAGHIINNTFPTDIQCSWYIAMSILLFIMLLNVLESVLASEDAKTATLRSLLVSGCMLLGALVGAITSIVIAVIIAIVIIIFVISVLFHALLGGGSSSSRRNDGKDELETTDLIEFMAGGGKVTGRKSADGLTFYGDNGKTYDRETTSSKDWYERN